MRKLTQLSDTELLAEFKRGHHKAFDILFLRYKTDLQKVILHYINDKVLAEDFMQDAFIKIYKSLCAGRYNEEGKFLPWALRIAHNHCMDHLRKARRTSLRPIDEKHEDNCLPADSCPELRMIQKQQEQQLHRLIHHLPEDQQLVVTYRYFEEMSFKEIATLMNTSVNTSLGRMRYALLHLRKQINNDRSFAWQ